MTLANVFGGFKGAITKKLAKEGLEEDFSDLIGRMNRKRKKNRLSSIKEMLVDRLGFDSNSRTVTEIAIDKRGRVGYYDEKLRDDSQDAFNIEKYGVPPGTFPNVDRLKHWIEAKGLLSKIKDPQLQAALGGSNINAIRGQTLEGNAYTNISDYNELGQTRTSDEMYAVKKEEILDRLAFLIGRKMERDGYTISSAADNADYLNDFDMADTDEFEVVFGADKIGWNKGQV